MADVATHLVDEVLPDVPVRQREFTFPWALRKRDNKIRSSISKVQKNA